MSEQIVSVSAANRVSAETERALYEYAETGLVAEEYIRWVLGPANVVISVNPWPDVGAADVRRQDLLERTNAAFRALRENQAAWEEELRERYVWDATLADGLEDA